MRKFLSILLLAALALCAPALAEPAGEYVVGEYVEFGAFEQDNDAANGAEPIQWRILQVEDDRVLLLSQIGLDCVPYNAAHQDVITWEASEIRAYLNDSFFNTAFTADEQARILTVTNENSAEGMAGWADSGAPTEDNVFLLSCLEADTLLKGKYLGRISDYAAIRGEYDLSTAPWDAYPWWLRSSGEESDTAAFCASNGRLDYARTDMRYFVVRPAIWISK